MQVYYEVKNEQYKDPSARIKQICRLLEHLADNLGEHPSIPEIKACAVEGGKLIAKDLSIGVTTVHSKFGVQLKTEESNFLKKISTQDFYGVVQIWLWGFGREDLKHILYNHIVNKHKNADLTIIKKTLEKRPDRITGRIFKETA